MKYLALIVLLAGLAAGVTHTAAHHQLAGTCDSRRPEWLACEDFETGDLGWPAWFGRSPFVECLGCTGANGNMNNPARIRLAQGAAAAHSGEWALDMPAEASAGYQGASLTYRSCAGAKRPGCRLTGYEALYFRTWVKLAPDHQLVHHFLDISGSRPDAYWESDGNAGCRPDGQRWAGATLDLDRNNQLFFYTYFPGMKCDRGGYCSGDYVQQICTQCATKNMPCRSEPECCWGNIFRPAQPVVLPKDEWVCLELSMHLNTPGQADGSMSFWVNDVLALDQHGMNWRNVPELQLNKAWLQHYIAAGDAQQSNRVWFDDVVVSTAHIGCGLPPAVATPTPVASATPRASATPEASATVDATRAPTATPSTPPTVRPAPTATAGPEWWRVYLPMLRRGG